MLPILLRDFELAIAILLYILLKIKILVLIIVRYFGFRSLIIEKNW